MKTVWKLTLRAIRSFKGRFIALMLIVAVGTSFFAGLKITRDAMFRAAEGYVGRQALYDYRLYSTLGFTDSDIKDFSGIDGVSRAEGTMSRDAAVKSGSSIYTTTIISLSEKVNVPRLTEGRLPVKAGECLADRAYFSSKDIGRTIALADDNKEAVKQAFSKKKFKITGLCDSPVYLSTERGTSSIGNGSVACFIYVPEKTFKDRIYTEADILLDKDSDQSAIYSSAYKKLIKSHKSAVKTALEDSADDRYDSLTAKYEREVSRRVKAAQEDARAAIMRQSAQAQQNALTQAQSGAVGGQIAAAQAAKAQEEALRGLDASIEKKVRKAMAGYKPAKSETYVLTRSENAGYVSFKSDTSIIYSLADIFPLFFVLIAMFICMTTISRMVSEERGQIGVMKALGYSNRAIVAKYVLYSALAVVFGWLVGFVPGTYALPKIFWWAYRSRYDFAAIPYVFDWKLAIGTFLAALVCVTLTAWLSSVKMMGETPAALMRPEVMGRGKKIMLERVTWLWKRLSFLHKIMFRNAFRYKKKLIMMLVGTSCCTALLAGGFGIRDTFLEIPDAQFDGVQTYELSVQADKNKISEISKKIGKVDESAEMLKVWTGTADISSEKDTGLSMSNVTLIAVPSSSAVRLSSYWRLAGKDGKKLSAHEQAGRALLSKRLAEKLDVGQGDKVMVKSGDRRVSVKSSGTFMNYVGNYAFVTPKEAENITGKDVSVNDLLIKTDGDPEKLAKKITKMSGVEGVTRYDKMRKDTADAVSVLNAVIWLIVGFSAALAFIVIYNLTNINIAERRREIATVEVLGFTDKETDSYVLRENVFLSMAAAIIGLPLGRLFHDFIIAGVLVDGMTFPDYISPLSYLLAFALTVVFALLVNAAMKRHISEIDMAESLKAVE